MTGQEAPATGAARSRWQTLKSAFAEFREDDLTDWAAALTYYSMLSLFPALLALVSIVGLFGDPESTTRALIDTVGKITPEATDVIDGPVEALTANRGAAGVTFVAALAVAIWSASGYVGAFARASNVIYEVREGRPFWKLRPLQLLVTLVIVLLMALVAAALVLTGPVVDAVGSSFGISETAVTAWNIAKWPVLGAVILTIISILYFTAPNVKLRGYRWITSGSIVAVALWLVASAAFAVYVANFGSYDDTYGSLGGVIVFLIWAWLTNLAMLFGAELDSEVERTREIEAGVAGADHEIKLPPRGEPDEPRTA